GVGRPTPRDAVGRGYAPDSFQAPRRMSFEGPEPRAKIKSRRARRPDLREQPAEGPAQLGGAIALVPAAVGEDDAFRLPGEHAFDRRLQLRTLACEGAAHVARHRTVRVLHAPQAGEPAHPPAAELAGFEVL